MSDPSEPVRIRLDVYSDYTCPWCYIGWARLEKAVAQLTDGVTVDIDWKPLEIHPEVPPAGMPVEDLPYSPEQWAQMQRALRRAAADEGIDISRRPKVSNTHRALLAGAYVQADQPDGFAKFHEALFEAYFARGFDLGDPDVITLLAEESGLDVAALQQALEDGHSEVMLTQTAEEARRLGITSTPTFLFDRRYVAVGAQPTDELLRALNPLA